MMQMRINMAEAAALHSLLEDGAGDILLRMDVDGFIETASSNIDAIGCDLSQSLIKPHLTDLAAQDFSSKIRDFIALELTRAMNPRSEREWLEIPVIPGSDPDAQSDVAPPVWYALSLRVVTADCGEVIGLLGLLRSVERSQALEGQLYSRAQINPGSGLPNRQAFSAQLERQIAKGSGGTLALFELDRMRALSMQYGQQTIDEIAWGFARFLVAMVPDEALLSQFSEHQFCVLLRQHGCAQGRLWVEEVLKTFASLTLDASVRALRLSASAGLAAVDGSVEETLRTAELALVMARASGGHQCVGTLPSKNTRTSNAL